jgi:D-lactate dehydrogenase (cytochrome)
MVDRALYYEGTCSGEHGVGYAKRHHLQKELGVDTIDVMRKIKLSLDPLRILNPDKIFKIDPFDKNH